MALSATTRRFFFRGVHALPHAGMYSEKRHGHRMFVEVSFTKVDPLQVEDAIASLIIQLDGHDLNQIVSPPTCEILVEWIDQQLRGILGGHLLGVAIQETRKNRLVSARSDARLI